MPVYLLFNDPSAQIWHFQSQGTGDEQQGLIEVRLMVMHELPLHRSLFCRDTIILLIKW